MSHDASNPVAKSPRASGLWMFFALAMVLLLLFWGATIWLTRWQGGDAEPEEAVRAEFRAKTLAEVRADDAKKLETYAWVDRAKGSVQIPVSAAMKLVLPEINSPPKAAYPVATPAPAVAPTPAAPAPITP